MTWRTPPGLEQASTVSNILSQAEIEALLNTLTDGGPEGSSQMQPQSTGMSINTSATGRAGRGMVAYEIYDFRRPDKFSKDQLRTLQMLHETFARLAGSGLSAFLRTQVQIDLISLEQVPYEEYLRSITQSVFTIMSLPPLTGQAVLEIEFSLIFTMIDRLLGGPGRAINRNVLTDIEKPLVRQGLDRMFNALKVAWEGVVIVNPALEGMETSAQFVQIAPPNDIVVTILFEVKIGNQRGAMSLCIPYLLLKPITTKLSAQTWFVSNSRKHSPQSRRMISDQIQQSKIECVVELGRAHLPFSKFLELKPGDVLRLNQGTEQDIRFLIQGVPKFSGKPALKGRKLVFSINDAIED